MKKFIMFTLLTFVLCNIAYGFSNSLDGSSPQNSLQTQQQMQQPSNGYQKMQNSPYVPKETTGYQPQNSQFQQTDTRYNSNCQFGNCIPGGFNNSTP